MKTPFQYNPFPVEAWFDFSITLTFAVPREELAARLPPCLEPDTFADQWGFLAVAIVQTRDLRPRGLPRFLGSNFISPVTVISSVTVPPMAAVCGDCRSFAPKPTDAP